MYVEAEEIFNFYKGRAQAYGVFDYLKLGHHVHEAVWSDVKGKWILNVEDIVTKHMIVDEAEVLINAGGFLKFVIKPTSPPI
jgi:cation diffusion facilitator CzcD-associated flavoprotein CzcO